MSARNAYPVFDAVEPFTVGLEEEVMLLDPNSLGLSERAGEVLERLGGDETFKPEMPASQLELITAAHADVPAAISELAGARRALLDAAEGLVRPAAAGFHPFSDPEGGLNAQGRYENTATEFGAIARRQLVCALQVHVAVGSSERTLAVYNGLREYLPLIAALAANAPCYRGRDSGLASVRPKVAELLPRQGVPPALPSWDAFAEELRWGKRAGAVRDLGSWWWELRPHLRFGTLELRVPDAQSTLTEAAGTAALIQALVAWLSERSAFQEPVATWRIEENRWSACRYGIDGGQADLRSGERRPTRELLHGLLDELEPVAERLGSAAGLAAARSLAERNGAVRQRAVFREQGSEGVALWLAERYSEGL
jgi:carboxylate-amine ligase